MNGAILFLSIAYWGSMGIDARSMALMNGTSPVVSGAPSVFVNPAGLPFSSRLTASFSYAVPYELNDLRYGEAAAAIRLKNFAIGAGYSGKRLEKFYSESNLILAAAVRGTLFDGMQAGIGLNLRNFRVSASEGEAFRRSNWAVDFGSELRFRALRLAYTFHNMTYTRNDMDYVRTAGIAVTRNGITAGFTYQWHRFYETYSLFAEVVVLKVLALRVGYGEGNMGIGAGIIARDYYIDFGMNEFEAGTGYSFTFGITR